MTSTISSTPVIDIEKAFLEVQGLFDLAGLCGAVIMIEPEGNNMRQHMFLDPIKELTIKVNNKSTKTPADMAPIVATVLAEYSSLYLMTIKMVNILGNFLRLNNSETMSHAQAVIRREAESFLASVRDHSDSDTVSYMEKLINNLK